MYNGSADHTIQVLILYAGIIGFLLVDFISRRRPYKVKKMPLTRWRIVYFAWAAEMLRLIVLAVLLCTLPTLAYIYDGIGFGGWIGSICTLVFFTCALLCIRLRLRWPAIRALHGKKCIPLPENAELENADGTWFYQDENWYIRVNCSFGMLYALLYAPQIDFEIPVQAEYRHVVKGSGADYLLFSGRDGMLRFARQGLDEKIEKWVKMNGGYFFRRPEPKKPYKRKGKRK